MQYAPDTWPQKFQVALITSAYAKAMKNILVADTV